MPINLFPQQAENQPAPFGPVRVPEIDLFSAHRPSVSRENVPSLRGPLGGTATPPAPDPRQHPLDRELGIAFNYLKKRHPVELKNALLAAELGSYAVLDGTDVVRMIGAIGGGKLLARLGKLVTGLFKEKKVPLRSTLDEASGFMVWPNRAPGGLMSTLSAKEYARYQKVPRELAEKASARAFRKERARVGPEEMNQMIHSNYNRMVEGVNQAYPGMKLKALPVGDSPVVQLQTKRKALFAEADVLNETRFPPEYHQINELLHNRYAKELDKAYNIKGVHTPMKDPPVTVEEFFQKAGFKKTDLSKFEKERSLNHVERSLLTAIINDPNPPPEAFQYLQLVKNRQRVDNAVDVLYEQAEELGKQVKKLERSNVIMFKPSSKQSPKSPMKYDTATEVDNIFKGLDEHLQKPIGIAPGHTLKGDPDPVLHAMHEISEFRNTDIGKRWRFESAAWPGEPTYMLDTGKVAILEQPVDAKRAYWSVLLLDEGTLGDFSKLEDAIKFAEKYIPKK